MKSVLALVAIALVTLVLEEKAREVAGEATVAYGEAVDQARGAAQSLSQSVKQQPLVSVLIASTVGYAIARLVPRR